MKLLLDTSPLQNASSVRGIGTYTRELLASLRELRDLPEPLIVQATHEVGQIQNPESHFDVVHYPFFDFFFSTLPDRLKLPTVVTVHDTIPLVFPDEYPAGIKGKLRFWGQKRRLKMVDAVITDSESSRRDIVKYLGVAEAKVYVVPLAASPKIVPPTEYGQQKARQELELPAKYALYIGDINYNKNLPTLLLALTQLPEDIHLCIVSATFGNTAIPEGERLADIITENGLRDRVHVLDIPQEKVDLLSSVIAAAKCLVQPSLYEGFGLPVIEAMQVGSVVVCANTSSLPEVAGEAAIMVEPTITGLADGIARAVSLRGEDREQIISGGQRHAANFSWEKTARQTHDVYLEAQKRFQLENGA